MPQQDYYSKWLKSLSVDVRKEDINDGNEDYYAGWSAKLAKEPPEAKHNWLLKELPQAIVESSPFLQKVARASGLPVLSAVAGSYQEPRQSTIDPKKALGSVTSLATDLAEKTGAWRSPLTMEDLLRQIKEGRDKGYKSVVRGEKGPGPVKKTPIGKSAVNAAAGVGKTILFPVELYVSFMDDPLKTIEERSGDLLFMAEGFFGPRVRLRMKSTLAKMKAGTATKAEIDSLVKAVAEGSSELAPPVTPPPTPPAPPAAPTPKPAAPKTPVGPKIKTEAPKPAAKEPWEMRVQRVEEKGVAPSGVDKPHGLYTSPAELESPHADLGGVRSTFETNPKANVLDLGTTSGFFKTNRGNVGESAGVAAARRLFGDQEVSRMMATRKSDLVSELKSREPKVSWERYYDQQEMVEGLAGIEARKKGYDAIWLGDKDPQFSEYVGLTKKAFTQDVSKSATETVEPVVAEPVSTPAAKPTPGNPIPPGMTTREFMQASSEDIEAAWAKAGGREVKGLGVQMVDDKGRPITMSDFLRQKRVGAAEDFIVAATGKIVEPPIKPIAQEPVAPQAKIILGPKEELLKRVAQAKTMTREQKKIISAERGTRLAAFEAATDGMTGVAKTRAFDKHFAGKHTRIQYEPFIEKLTPDAIDGLHAMVWDSPLLGKFEKRSTIDGLAAIMFGQQPQKAQLEKLTRVFGGELVDALMKHSSSTEKLIRLMVDVGNIPRAFMASMDLSAPFRQGLVMISRPKQFFPAMGKMFGYFGSEESYHALLKDIVSRPTYGLMKRGGLSITEVGGVLGKAEEVFASRLANKVPLVKASARAYTGFLDKLRADVFDDLISKARKIGLDPDNSDDLLKSIGSFVNTATGRGDIKAFNRAATLMNSFFFSPRLAYSRLQMMNPLWYAKQTPFVRKEAIKSVLTSMGVGATVVGMARLAGVDVSFNPRTADFLKLKFGNTRIDVFGGMSQYWRLFLNLGDQMLQRVGITEKEKGGANGLDRIHRFIEAKEAPVASLATDILRGKTFLGEELKLDRMLATRLIPMLGQDLYDVIKDDPENLASIAFVFSSGMFGAGAQTYETKKKKPKRMY